MSTNHPEATVHTLGDDDPNGGGGLPGPDEPVGDFEDAERADPGGDSDVDSPEQDRASEGT